MGMRLSGLFLLGLALTLPLHSQKHELGLTLGRLTGGSRGEVDLGGGTALQANYGVRIAGGGAAAFYGEFTLLASPLRDVASPNSLATRDFATLYLTPGLRVKLAPGSSVSPYIAFGGGYALYEQSTHQRNGLPNPAPRHVHRAAFVYGGGVDVRLEPWLALRGEIRDFYTGSPAFNVRVPGRQHNIAVSGGFVLRLGE